jgi:hypothetical protein
MSGNTVFGEHISNEEGSKGRRVDLIRSGDEDALLWVPINDNQDGSVSVGLRKVLDKVHRDGVPGTSRNRELLQKTIGTMTRGLSSATSGTGGDEVVDELSDSGPYVLASNKLNGLVDSEVSS